MGDTTRQSSRLEARRKTLAADYERATGKRFTHFFCPLLFVDEDVALCRAHVVNQAFESGSRKWTVQRRDVDNFYGERFEAPFTAIRYRGKDLPQRALTDPKLRRVLRPELLAGERRVRNFLPQKGASLPPGFVALKVPVEGKMRIVAAELSEDEMKDDKVQIVIEKDLRLVGLVATLKAAHLTSFALGGYRYALSAGGEWLGRRLGEFFSVASKAARENVDPQAFFKPLAPLVNPVKSAGHVGLEGSIDDRKMEMCVVEGTDLPWASLTYVRTDVLLSAVLLPVLDSQRAKNRFEEHLANTNLAKLEVARMEFTGEEFRVSPHRRTLEWPVGGW